MRAVVALGAVTLAVVGVMSSCGGSDRDGRAEAPVPTATVSSAIGPLSDATSPTTASPATMDPASAAGVATSPSTISIDVSGTKAASPLSTPPTTSPPLSFPPPQPLAAEYRGSGRIIEHDGQPQLAVGIDSSFPPTVWFGLPLVGWDWALVDGESADGTTVWTDTPYSVVGAWDGTRLTLTRPPEPATDDVDTRLPDGQEPPTPGCELADAQSAVASDEAAAAGLAFVGPPIASSGDCYVIGVAVTDNPELQAVLAPVADRVRLDYLLQPAS